MLTRRTLLRQLGATGLLGAASLSLDRAWVSAATPAQPDDDDAEAVTGWADLLLRLIRNTRGFTPPVAARAIGYFGVSVYETVVTGSATHRPLGIVRSSAFAPELADWPLAANAAAGAIVRALFPMISADDRTATEDLEAANRARHVGRLSAELVEESERFGRTVAGEVYAWSMSDGGHEGFRHNVSPDYELPVGPGQWEPTLPSLTALQPTWGSNRCFLVKPSMCPAAPPTPYSEDPDSAFYAEALEVVETVNGLSAEQEEIAHYWGDDPGVSPTPAGHSLSIATQALRQTGASLTLAAETYAKVGIAVSDAFVSAWAEKYRYNQLRPVTYARRHIDPQWTPVLDTPPFPEHPSGHSVQSGAAFTVLTDLFGDLYAFTDHTHDVRGFAPRSFPSFSAAGEEAAISRLYAGIHFRPAADLGLEQGRCIGRHVNALALRR